MQNQEFKEELISTSGSTLVECSPNLWGIGLSAKDERAADRRWWRGKNKFGYVLTHIRDYLSPEAEANEIVKNVMKKCKNL
ncbi:hypothetical protein L596_030372 [Steinernema carpocapsae]|nr:hypothetical protein L596_030372 [Steinernema carpocapsae]